MTASTKIAEEIARALVAAFCDDTETTFDQLCEEADLNPDDVKELQP